MHGRNLVIFRCETEAAQVPPPLDVVQLILSHVIWSLVQKKLRRSGPWSWSFPVHSEKIRLIMIGKRKRETTVASRSRKTDDSPSPPPAAADNAQDIFRKYFESQFEPLDLPPPRPTEGLSSEDEGDEDDSDVSESEEEWGGASDEDDEGEDGNVEVVEYKDTRMTPDLKMDKKARKAFMVCTLLSWSTSPALT